MARGEIGEEDLRIIILRIIKKIKINIKNNINKVIE
jgi:hypothetical protein